MARRQAQSPADRANARRMYLAGADVTQIAAALEASPAQVEAWKATGAWSVRRQHRLADPRGAAQALRELLGQRVEELLAHDALDAAAADELAKIGAVVAKLEGCGYDLKAAAVEVAERLADFAAGRESDAARLAWLADLLDAFFLDLAQGA